MKFSAKQISDILNGRIEGNPDVLVDRLSKIEEASGGSISFLSNTKYTHFIYTTGASVVIVNDEFVPEKSVKTTLIRVKDAYSAFTMLLEYYNKFRFNKKGIEQPSFIAPDAEYGDGFYLGAFAYIGPKVKIGKNVKIYPQAYVGDGCVIGDDVILYAGVKIYHDCVIGNGSIVNSGAVIGADGFGFAPQPDGTFKKIPQTGNVVLEDNVEIGANTAIDRATLGSTVIKKGVKLDNLIQIAHNVEIGENTVMASQAGVAGSSKLGKNCIIGGQVGIAGHLKIGSQVQIGAQSGIMDDVEDKKIFFGYPAMESKHYMRSFAVFKKLPEINTKLNQLEKRNTNK